MTSPTEHLRPADLHTQLGTWVAAGLLSDDQAGRILAFEGGTPARPALPESLVPGRDGAGPAAAPSSAAVPSAALPATTPAAAAPVM